MGGGGLAVAAAEGDEKPAADGQSDGDRQASPDPLSGHQPIHQHGDHRLGGEDGGRGDRAGIADAEGVAGGEAADAAAAQKQDPSPGQAQGQDRRALAHCDDAGEHRQRQGVAAGGDDEGRQILQQHRGQGHHRAPGHGGEQQARAGDEFAARRGSVHLGAWVSCVRGPLSAWSA